MGKRFSLEVQKDSVRRFGFKVDKIYVIEEGKVVEEGVHETLLEKNGVYKLLYSSEFNVTSRSLSSSISGR